jgi:hypothetical protein
LIEFLKFRRARKINYLNLNKKQLKQKYNKKKDFRRAT